MSEKEQDDFFTSRIRQTEKFIYTKEGGVRMTEKRTDTEGRELFCGEYERQDGRILILITGSLLLITV